MIRAYLDSSAAQATDPASAAAGTTDLQAQPAAAAQQPSLLPALPNIFGRKLQQVILNPGDLVGCAPTTPRPRLQLRTLRGLVLLSGSR